MGELWRSKEMTQLQIFLQYDAAHATLEAIGELGLVQFIDLNHDIPPHQRAFVPDLRRLHEMEEIITLITKEIYFTNLQLKVLKRKADIITIVPAKDVSPENTKHVDELEVILKEILEQLNDLKDKQQQLDNSILMVKEHQVILGKRDEGFFSQADRIESDEGSGPDEVSLDDAKETEEEDDDALTFIAGIIPTDKMEQLEIVLFRITKGQSFLNIREQTEEITVSGKDKPIEKSTFVCFCRGKYIKDKITKLIKAFGGNIYPVPSSSKARQQLRERLVSEAAELDVVLHKSVEQRKNLFENVAEAVDLWYHYILNEQAIFHNLNMFNYNTGRQTLIAECWCPTEAIPKVSEVLKRAQEKSGSSVETVLTVIESNRPPPTYFNTNKFTKVFQKIVDSYGTARYREINPAVFTIITFPWQFGIMFGDVGHGFLLLLFALFLLSKEKDWENEQLNEMVQWAYNGRYLIFLMALYAMWMGALYNEFFAVTMDFGSAWTVSIVNQTNKWNEQFQTTTWLHNGQTDMRTYVFGVDPVWKGSTNELLYYNSVKMKMSIIVGVIQMSVGIFLHLLNGIAFRKYLDIFFDFFPRFIFLESIFGYLCFMIFYKWGVDWVAQDTSNRLYNTTMPGTQGAPVILNELIFMFLPGGANSTDRLYQGQSKVQVAMVVLAGLSLPWMLAKPCVEWGFITGCDCSKKQKVHKHDNNDEGEVELETTTRHKEVDTTVVSLKRETHEDVESSASLEEEDNSNKVGVVATPKPAPVGVEEEEYQFSEACIHNLLETIEFVLGSVSHTASYLRLWALSLAHSELATVFWEKIMFQVFQVSLDTHWVATGIIGFLGFSVWFGITLMVMMFMELLSALLHALRLHWVEFQSKFYKGDGTPFRPFSLRKVHGNKSVLALAQKLH